MVTRVMAWRQATIRGKKVWARCSDAGELTARGGRVEIRYGTGESKAYHASVQNLQVDTSGEVMPDSHCGDARAEAPSSKSRAKGKKANKKTSGPAPPTSPTGDEVLAYCDGACSGNPGPAGLGAVMIWDDERQ